MFSLCESFIITAKQAHEPCHLKRLVSFICNTYIYSLGMRILVQLLIFYRITTEISLDSMPWSMAMDDQDWHGHSEFHTMWWHSDFPVSLTEFWTGKWKGWRHSEHLGEKRGPFFKFFQVKSGESTCGLKGSFIIQKNGPGNENLPEKNEFYKDKGKVVYLGKYYPSGEFLWIWV